MAIDSLDSLLYDTAFTCGVCSTDVLVTGPDAGPFLLCSSDGEYSDPDGLIVCAVCAPAHLDDCPSCRWFASPPSPARFDAESALLLKLVLRRVFALAVCVLLVSVLVDLAVVDLPALLGWWS